MGEIERQKKRRGERRRETKQQSTSRLQHLKAGVERKKKHEKMRQPWSERVDGMHSASVSAESGDAY